MIKLYSVEALILRARDFGEADKILTIYTREEGKCQAIAKGVRKSTSRLRGGVQPLTHSRLLLYRGRTLDTVSQSENICAYAALRDDLVLLSAASYLAELLEAAVPEREPHEEIFQLGAASLGLLLAGDPELVVRFFELRLLDLLGYRPMLSSCAVCDRPLEGGTFFLDPDAGGLVCRDCAVETHRLVRISPGTALTMERLLTTDDAGISRLKISPAARGEMDAGLGKYLEYHLDKKLKARAFFRQMIAR